MGQPERRAAFLDEARFLVGCDHPAVMRVFDDGTFTLGRGKGAGEYPFLIAEYLPKTLWAVIRAESASITEKTIFATQLVSAVAYLAAQDPPVIHRDIKPSNIFVKGHTCVLGDFGLLKRLDEVGDQDRAVLKESVGFGMPHFYRSPDLVDYANKESEITPKSDIFQLGLVLAELYTGRNPCCRPQGDDPLSPIELEELRGIASNHGGLIVPILRRMLEMDPKNRPSAEELMDHWTGAFGLLADHARALNGAVL
jgi:serine/threonine protein kinase